MGLGHGSRVMRVIGKLTDGSRGSQVTKCDPLSAAILNTKVPSRKQQGVQKQKSTHKNPRNHLQNRNYYPCHSFSIKQLQSESKTFLQKFSAIIAAARSAINKHRGMNLKMPRKPVLFVWMESECSSRTRLLKDE